MSDRIWRGDGDAARTYLLFAVVLIDSLAAGVANPTLPRLVKEIAPPGVSVIVVAIGLAVLIDLLQFIFAPIVMSLSDAVGRRAVMLWSFAIVLAANLLRASATDIAQLAAASLVIGMFAGQYGATLAAIADYTSAAQRAARFGLMGSAMTLGYTLGPMFGGVLADLDPRFPYHTAWILGVLDLVLVAVLFRETLAQTLRKPFQLKMRNPLEAVTFYRRAPQLPKLAFAYAALQSTMAFLPVLIPIYLLENLHWSGGKAGIYLAFMSGMSFVFQASLTGPLTQRLGPAATSVAALVVGAVGFGLVGISPSEWLLWLGAVLMPMRNIATATLVALMSAQVPPDEQGRLQGSNASLFGVARVAAQLGLLGSYGVAGASGASTGVGAPFLLAAAVLVVAAATVWSVRRLKTAEA